MPVSEAVFPPLALWWPTMASTMSQRCPVTTYVKCRRHRGLLQAFAKMALWSPGVMQHVEGIQSKLHISLEPGAKVMPISENLWWWWWWWRAAFLLASEEWSVTHFIGRFLRYAERASYIHIHFLPC